VDVMFSFYDGILIEIKHVRINKNEDQKTRQNKLSFANLLF